MYGVFLYVYSIKYLTEKHKMCWNDEADIGRVYSLNIGMTDDLFYFTSKISQRNGMFFPHKSKLGLVVF